MGTRVPPELDTCGEIPLDSDPSPCLSMGEGSLKIGGQHADLRGKICYVLTQVRKTPSVLVF